VPLSWNEIRARAAVFAEEWKDAHYEKGETQSFYNEFFGVFGRRRRDVAVYEEKVKKLNNTRGFIDLFWPGQLLVEQKSAGLSLENARNQATDYFLNIKELEKPRYILLSDFQSFELLDLETRAEERFLLSELPDKVRLFGFIAGYQQQQYKDQDPANVEAATLMSNLHFHLEESGYTGTDLEHLLVRIMFCLFADDTGIFEPYSFLHFIQDRTSEDGSDLGSRLVHLFEILDSPQAKRQKTLDEDLARFPYVNGKLFTNHIRTPSFNSEMRASLIDCCLFDWSKVSPALFGSLFQTVMIPAKQRQGGAHYTSERNILKTIHPLFLDELRGEFLRIRDNKSTHRKALLEKFHVKLGSLTFLDPACGCGNFLILAYRELRLLEIEVLEEIFPRDSRNLVLDISLLSKVDVDQFYGIEIEEFPARIAETAMWLVDHQMNMRLSESFGQAFVRLPLQKSAHIVHGNALRLDWLSVIDPSKLSYILGNPPFVGARKKSEAQAEEMERVFQGVKNAGNLDYVAAWYLRAAQYIKGTNIKVAFVSTNSITQGEQVGILWQVLLNRYSIHIHFAHRTFKWTIDEKKAKGMKIAAVYCIIVGFGTNDQNDKSLFEYDRVNSDPHFTKAKNINPYLVDASDTIVTSRTKPISDAPPIVFGNMPNDGGHLLLNDAEKDELLKVEPGAEKFIRPLLGSEEFINGISRWCIWLRDAQPAELKGMPHVLSRMERVRANRLASKRAATQRLAATPSLFGEIRHPKGEYLLIPKTSSERRLYIPIGIMPNHVIPTECLIVPDATLYHFGILTSLMHMVWVSYVCGRLKSDYRYSNTLVYNNYPWPRNLIPTQINDIEGKAQAVLDARAQFSGSTLADLYDPLTMPPVLLKAHQALDKSVDKSYRKEAFLSERERIEFLFGLYHQMTAPLIAKPPKRTRRNK
jgi:hypothetical protein